MWHSHRLEFMNPQFFTCFIWDVGQPSPKVCCFLLDILGKWCIQNLTAVDNKELEYLGLQNE